MKIYIEQDDIKLSFERVQELDYQTLFKAYQMVTGSDETLEDLSQKEPENTKTVLKNDAEIDPVNIKESTDRLSAKFSGSQVVSQKPSEKVDVDLQCPFCGCAKRWKVPSYFKFMNCPDCQGSIFLSWATGVKGELDDNGFYFRGDSPMKFKEQTDEFEDMFAIEESK
nr:MAG TPA: cysteine-rich protein [Caudoviricetes sp.]